MFIKRTVKIINVYKGIGNPKGKRIREYVSYERSYLVSYVI